MVAGSTSGTDNAHDNPRIAVNTIREISAARKGRPKRARAGRRAPFWGSMLRVCAVCKKIFGCYRGLERRDCDSCDLVCRSRNRIAGDGQAASHGLCDSCFSQGPSVMLGPFPRTK